MLKYDFFHEVFFIYIEVLSFAMANGAGFLQLNIKRFYGNSSIQHFFFFFNLYDEYETITMDILNSLIITHTEKVKLRTGNFSI